MFSGYMYKRNVPISPPSMQKVYCMLWGTLLLDFENEEDSKSSSSPKCVAEVLGISEWDGQGRANQYQNGFLIVTHTGLTYYCSALSVHDRNEWILHVKRAVECNFANPDIAPFKPSKFIQSRPHPASNLTCPKTKATLSNTNILCNSCGRSFSSSEYISDTSVFLQLGSEEPEKCCNDCKISQIVIIWMKTLNYYHVITLHEHTPSVVRDVHRFKASFQLRRRISSRLNMAASLMESNSISKDEFEELRRVDHEYRRELIFEESGRLREALDTIGDDMQMLIEFLLNPSITERGGRMAYYQIIKAIIVLADEQPELIDFYWPQLIHVHFIESSYKNSVSLMKVDLFQQLLLAIAQKYPSSLGVKLAWSLLATVGDYQNPALRRVTQRQFAAAMSLLLQLELIITGVVSPICDVPLCKLLAKTLVPASHQQQELAYELGILCLVRRRLQEVYDEEEVLRLKRNETRGLELASQSQSNNTNNRLSSRQHESNSNQNKSVMDTPSAEDSYDKNFCEAQPHQPIDKFKILSKGRRGRMTCVQLFMHLGVGQAVSSNKPLESSPNRMSIESNSNEVDDEDNNSTGVYMAHWPSFGSQLDCFDSFTSIVEMLRFVDRPVRTATLRHEFTKMMENGTGATLLGWDPLMPAGAPSYRVMKIEIEECRVFRTKARAPSLIVCQVLRESTSSIQDKIDYVDDPPSAANLNASSSPGSHGPRKLSLSIDEVDGLVESSMLQAIADIQIKKKNSQTSVIQNDSQLSPASRISRSKSEVFFTEQSSPRQLSSLSAKHSTPSFSSSPKDILIKANSITIHNNSSGQSVYLPSHHNSYKRPSFVASHRKSINFFSLLESFSNDDLPRNLTTTPKAVPSTSPTSTSGQIHAKKENNHPAKPMRVTSFEESDAHTHDDLSSHSSTKSFMDKSTTDLDFLLEIVEAPILPEKDSATNHGNHGSHESGNVTATAAALMNQTSATNTALVTRKVFNSAQKLLLSGKISEREYNELILSDFKYRHASQQEEDIITMNKVESSFGESWNTKKDRILGDRHVHKKESHQSSSECPSPKARQDSKEQWNENDGELYNGEASRQGHHISSSADSEDRLPLWDLRAFIVKSNDDMRQEMCCMQVMQLCSEIFQDLSLDRYLWLRPYSISAISNSTGILEVIPDTLSIDALKKTPGFTNLSNYFKTTYGSSAERLLQAKRNFASSLAAYSLFCHILAVKDRHNGNMLLDVEGHIVHIDFGFILSIAPGGSFSLETAPFKLTEEMVEVLGGLESPLFGQFVKSFTVGFLALRSHIEVLISCMHTLSVQSPFPCFAGKDSALILDRVRSRFRQDLNPKDFVKHCLDLIVASYSHYGTKQYDSFQWYTNGILP